MHKINRGNSFILVKDKPMSKPKELQKHSCECCKKYLSTKANLKQHTDKFHSYNGDQADLTQATNNFLTVHLCEFIQSKWK